MEHEFQPKQMKSKTTQYTKVLIGAAALMISSSALAEEAVIEPQIVICPPPPHGIDIADEDVTDDVATVEELADEKISDEDVEVVVDDKEVVKDDEVLIACWDFDWSKRENDDDAQVYLYMATDGPAAEATGGIAQNSAPQAADETSAVTKVEKNTVSANIRRVANKPTAVKSNGRVFLR